MRLGLSKRFARSCEEDAELELRTCLAIWGGMIRDGVNSVGSSVRLFLVRHAAHADVGRRLTGRAGNAGLTEGGDRQAAALARRLSGEALHEIHTSPCHRARATAEAIAGACGVPLRVTEHLDEIDFGEWTGAEFSALDADPGWRHWNARRGTARPPGGESMDEAVARIAAHAAELAECRAGEAVVLVTHADMIRGFIARVLGLSFDNLMQFDVSPASISRVEAGSWGARVLSVNEAAGESAW